jgi:hypothetical protein
MKVYILKVLLQFGAQKRSLQGFREYTCLDAKVLEILGVYRRLF